MRIRWVDELVKTGSIRQSVRDGIYEDCAALIKEAEALKTEIVKQASEEASAVGGPPRTVEAEIAQGIVGSGINGLIASGLNAIGAGVTSRRDAINSAKQLHKNRMIISADPQFRKNPDKAAARFDELARIAPHVAQNEALARRLVTSRYQSGLSDNDVMNLATLQARMQPNVSTQNSHLSRYERQMPSNEKSAAAWGETCADVVYLCKTAGILSKINPFKNLSPAMKSGLKTTAILSAAPLLYGAGHGAVQHTMSIKNKEDLEKKLQKSYTDAMKLSDPDREPLHSKKDEARRAFKTLAHFAPNVASNPSAARAFMNKLVDYEMGVDVDSIKSLTEIEKNLSQVSRDPDFLQGFLTGADSAGLKQVVSGGIGNAIKPIQEGIGKELAVNAGF